MKCSLTAISLLLVGFVALGCGREEGSVSVEPEVPNEPAPKSAEVDLAFLRYDTGEPNIVWPDYGFPLNHSFDTLEPPPEIIGPFSAEDIPTEE